MINEKIINDCKKQLDERFYALREEVRQALLQSDEQPYLELAGIVHDIPEQSVADMLVDLNYANIHRHVKEIRDIDAALLRITDGNYGICGDCNRPIAAERLHACPTAKRCHDCQAQHEKTYIQGGHASL